MKKPQRYKVAPESHSSWALFGVIASLLLNASKIMSPAGFGLPEYVETEEGERRSPSFFTTLATAIYRLISENPSPVNRSRFTELSYAILCAVWYKTMTGGIDQANEKLQKHGIPAIARLTFTVKRDKLYGEIAELEAWGKDGNIVLQLKITEDGKRVVMGSNETNGGSTLPHKEAVEAVIVALEKIGPALLDALEIGEWQEDQVWGVPWYQ